MIADNLPKIQARIAAACQRAHRDPSSVTLVGVSKFQSVGQIEEAARAGVKVFAESRQQEASSKLPALKQLGTWHFIGHLQGNKARSVVELFDVVESVDSLALATKLSALALEAGRRLPVFAQINISGEAQKYGFPLASAQADLDAIAKLPGLELQGLMGMAAQSENPENARPAFVALRKLAQSRGGLKLSMGMSADFEVAIEEGADLVRIGTALFG
ncbi:MAG: YggS family pyridoxal phosphate-dependent enzyme [candidate division FCPU426 bacterium]